MEFRHDAAIVRSESRHSSRSPYSPSSGVIEQNRKPDPVAACRGSNAEVVTKAAQLLSPLSIAANADAVRLSDESVVWLQSRFGELAAHAQQVRFPRSDPHAAPVSPPHQILSGPLIGKTSSAGHRRLVTIIFVTRIDRFRRILSREPRSRSRIEIPVSVDLIPSGFSDFTRERFRFSSMLNISPPERRWESCRRVFLTGHQRGKML